MEGKPTGSAREFRLLLITFLGYGVFYGLSQIAGNATFPVTFWIPELNRQVTIGIPWESWLSIFITGAGFAVLLMRIFDEIFLSEKSVIKTRVDISTIRITRDMFLFTVALYVLGNAVHEVIKFVGYMLPSTPMDLSNQAYSNLYYYIYFYHEYFGHIMFSIPLMIFLTIFAFAFVFEPPSRKLRWYEWLLIFGIGIGFGAVWVEGWAEGECQLVNAIYDIGLLVAIGIVAKKQKVALRSHPFICVVVVEAITFIIGVIIWGLVFGLLPYYPFFKEPP
jgi:phosphate/sulfate permease